MRWNHLYSNKVFANASLIFSSYKLGIGFEIEDTDIESKLSYSSDIQDYTLKYDLNYLPNPHHNIRAGFIGTRHIFNPSSSSWENKTEGDVAQDTSILDQQDKILGTELAAYIEDEISWRKWRINVGFRLSTFLNDKIQYVLPEPRLSMGYLLNSSTSIKASYTQMNQFVQLLSNSGIGLPNRPLGSFHRPAKTTKCTASLAWGSKRFFRTEDHAHYRRILQGSKKYYTV